MDSLDIFEWNNFQYTKTFTGEKYQITIVAYNGSETSVTFPNSINGLLVTALGNGKKSVFSSDCSVETIVVSDGIIIINPYAFAGSAKLKKIILPSFILKIGEAAFYGCKKLKTINLPEINEISDRLFENSGISKISLPASINLIGKNSFNATKLKSIVIPDNCQIIKDNSFALCRYLKEVKLPQNLKSLGQGAFDGCEALNEITMPDTIKVIEDYTFLGCTNLMKISLSSNLERIGNGAFELCIGLTDIKLPETITSIGDKAFRYCENLSEIVFPANMKMIGESAFSGCKKLYNIRSNANILHIAPYAFDNTAWFERQNDGAVYFESTLVSYKGVCSQKQLVIRDGTVIISDFALLSLDFEELILPEGLEEIGKRAFAMCKKLKYIRFPQSLRYIGEKAFYECDSIIEIIIPKHCIKIGQKAFLRSESDNTFNVHIYGTQTVLEDKSIGYRLVEVKKENSRFGSIEEMTDPMTVIYAYDLSTAQNYSLKNKLSFKIIDNETNS